MLRKITINRQPSQRDWTLSTFTADDGSFKGVGVEDEKRNVKVHGETRIDAGLYELTLTDSPKFSKEYYRDEAGNLILAKDWAIANSETKLKYKYPHQMITVNGVKNFSRILWHWGNDDLDTEGCYLVGSVFGKSKRNRDGVVNSRKKYTEIYPIIFRALKVSKVFAQYIDNEL